MSKDPKLKILLLEDNPDDVILIERELRKGGIVFEKECVDTRSEFTEQVEQFKPDVVLSDHGLPQFNSLEALKVCKAAGLHVPFILVTGTVSEEFAISCLRNGADDYILKSNLSRLPIAIRRAMKERKLEQLKHLARRSLRAQNAALKKAHAELDRFVYSISHNLRGPLASVIGLINVAYKENDVRQLHLLNAMMDTSVGRLDDTLREILDYSQNARKEIQHTPISWNGLIQESFKRLEYLDREGMTTRLIEVEESEPFHSDSYRLGVILNNVLSNALTYRVPGREHIVLVRLVADGTRATLTVKDNGQGIEQGILPKIFDMFYRGNERSQGAGLGLYVVKEMVTKLDGEIRIESAMNAGSTITIVFPKRSAEPFPE